MGLACDVRRGGWPRNPVKTPPPKFCWTYPRCRICFTIVPTLALTISSDGKNKVSEEQNWKAASHHQGARRSGRVAAMPLRRWIRHPPWEKATLDITATAITSHESRLFLQKWRPALLGRVCNATISGSTSCRIWKFSHPTSDAFI